MASILLNDVDPASQHLLRSKLERLGHDVWVAGDLNDIVAILHDVVIDLMILDLDRQNPDELLMFADRWKGILILFQATCADFWEDFRCKVADEVICKNHNGENITRLVSQLLQEKRYLKKTVNKLILRLYSPIDHSRAPNHRLRCVRSNMARLYDLSACQRARIQL
jgi:DNA-binding NtrC family response regulator